MSALENTLVNDIREALAAAIPAGEESVFGSVYAYPTSEPSGWPAAVVVTSDHEADWASTATDRFTFGFAIQVMFPMASEEDMAKAEKAVGLGVGEILRVFSAKGVLRDAGVDWVIPVPGQWTDAALGEGVVRLAEISIRCVVYAPTG